MKNHIKRLNLVPPVLNNLKLGRIIIKKDISSLPKAYMPQIENEIYKKWEDNNSFKAEESENRFSMILPPPNVTGTLHLGHALTVAIQDTIARYQRMCGKQVLWVPGMDHAGIATQVVVERELKYKLKQTNLEIGRQKFIKHVWDWKEIKGNHISSQLKRLGASLDWSQEYFTLDDVQNKSVNQALFKLWDDGLIYRGEALVNWSCVLQTAISDIEVDHLSVDGPTDLNVPGYSKPVRFGEMISFCYKIIGSDEEIVVSTTRIETLLGDVAIAVHPHDTRYKNLIGSKAIHPFTRKLLPIIADQSVDPKYGTGAVKITPAHDPIDFETAKRHNLPFHNVIDEKGFMTNCEFCGMHRFQVREIMKTKLSEMGLLRSINPHSYQIPVCSRSKDVIEFLIKKQWFIKCKEMGSRAAEALRKNELIIKPEKYHKTWLSWLDNIKDWCISRQLWWGHQIPFYNCSNQTKNIWIAANDENEALKIAQKTLNGDIKIHRDPDVLDTWFSSALLPFSSLGWIQNNHRKFYPLNIMVTGHDILFFWVARMTMLGLQITNKLPFKEVLLHSIICDTQGRKMSKSLGNVIDPIDIIDGCSQEKLIKHIYDNNSKGLINNEELSKAENFIKKQFPKGIPTCGADALRFTLLSQCTKNLYLNFNIDECNGSRLLCNKIWQATKFALNWSEKFNIIKINIPKELNEMDKWILNQLSNIVKISRTSYENHDFNIFANSLKSFIYGDLCGLYIESIKPLLQNSESGPNSCLVLLHCLDLTLRCLGPMMPYIAETLYKELPEKNNTSIMFESFPEIQQFKDEKIENKVNLVKNILHNIRSLKTDNGMLYKTTNVHIKTIENISSLKYVIETLGICNISFVDNEPSCKFIKSVESGTEIYLLMDVNQKHVDSDSIIKKRKKIETALNKIINTSSTQGYKDKVSQEIKEAHRLKIIKLKKELEDLKRFSM